MVEHHERIVPATSSDLETASGCTDSMGSKGAAVTVDDKAHSVEAYNNVLGDGDDIAQLMPPSR